MNIRKYLVSFVFVVFFAGYAALQHLNGSAVAYTAATTPASTQQVAETTSAPQSAPPPQSTPVQTGPAPIAQATTPAQPAPAATPAPQPQGQYVSGTYIGASEDAYWGMVQVKAVIKNGALAKVQILQFPNSHGTSVYINDQALPILQSEAIQAQSANVNGVSGATYTSQAFQQSLASALSQAS